MTDLYLFLAYSAALLGVMFTAEIAYRFFKLNTEWTRKIAHIGSGIVALTYPDFIDNHLIVLALTLSFTFILFICKKLGWFPSIFAVGRKSYGELLFVWSAWLLFWLYQYSASIIYFYLPFSVVVFADPLAALVGKKFPVKRYTIFNHIKSVGGSTAFFITTLLLSYYFMNETAWVEHTGLFALFHAVLLTLVEAVSVKGWDNLSIPAASVLFLYLVQI